MSDFKGILIGMLVVAVLYMLEAVLNGIWIDALVNRKRKMKKEVATMKAKDLLRK